MIPVLVGSEADYSEEFSESASYFGRPHAEEPDDIVGWTEAGQAVVAMGYSDFCMPVEDWLLD